MPRKYKRKYNYREVFKFILQFKEHNDGNSPSLREICDACGISSKSVCNHILGILEEQGKIYLERDHKFRNIKVIGARWQPPGRPG